MSYTEEVEEKLKQAGATEGDTVKVNSGVVGKLQPKPNHSQDDIIVLKLDSGYNIGVKPDSIELIEKGESNESEKPSITYSDSKDDILVLHTGGTIASRVSYQEGGVAPKFDPEDLVEMYPNVADEVNIHSEVVAQMLSEDMEPEHWVEIAEKIDQVKDDYDGIIVGHGTDTMSFTGAALQLMLKGIDKPVILVGAQRSSDRPSSDARMNMYCASKFIQETEFTGIGICMHNSIEDKECVVLDGAKTRKMHTSRRDAFQQINTDPVGKVDYKTGEVQVNKETSQNQYKPGIGMDPNVELIKTYPGMSEEVLEGVKDRDPSGLVIEGTGLGHMPVNSFDEYTEHHSDILDKIGEIASEIPVVMASQCVNGRVDMNVYDAGRKLQDRGVVSAEDMHPELAYVKLSWALEQTENKDQATELFRKNVAGEKQSRSKP